MGFVWGDFVLEPYDRNVIEEWYHPNSFMLIYKRLITILGSHRSQAASGLQLKRLTKILSNTSFCSELEHASTARFHDRITIIWKSGFRIANNSSQRRVYTNVVGFCDAVYDNRDWKNL